MISVPFVTEFIQTIKKNSIDDFQDRVYHYTVILLTFFAVVVLARNFTGPIECMMPAEYPHTWTEYVKEFCYISSTYFVQANNGTEERRLSQGYYQWVAFILVIQALLIYLPSLAWKTYVKTLIIDFSHVIEKAKELRYVMGEEYDKGLKALTGYCRERLQHQGTVNGVSSTGFGMKYALSHLIAKLLTMFIIILEISFMNGNFGPEYDPVWGFTMLKQGLTNSRWNVTGIFPRLTFCDFNQPILGGRYPRRTVQCVLPQNLMNEKTFIFTWLWLAFILLLSIFDMFYFVYTLFNRSHRHKTTKYFVQPGLKDDGDVFDIDDSRKERIINFGCDIFGADGIYLLKCIKLNGGSLIATDIASKIVQELYEETEKEKNEITVDIEPTKEEVNVDDEVKPSTPPNDE